MESKKRTRVLFVCLGNACRSPMAEAIATHLASDIMEVSSAGLTPLGQVESMTKLTLARNGYPVENLDSKPLLLADFDAADVVINMSGRPSIMAIDDPTKVEEWRVEDPYGAGTETYQRIFEEIEQRVVQLVGRLRTSIPSKLSADKNVRERR